MAEFVIDTNAWIMASSPADLQTKEELACAEAASKWIREFIGGADSLVVDADYQIIGEYRRYAPRGGLLERWLNDFERSPRDRLIEVPITLDKDGYANVRPGLEIPDKNDRKFIAVALAHTPTPPIVNATDTDWQKTQPQLQAAGIVVIELCERYIQEKLMEQEI